MEGLVGGEVGDLDLEEVVEVAGDVVGLYDFGQLGDRAFEGEYVGTGVADEPDAGDHPEAAPDRCRVDHRAVATDHAGFLEAAYASQAGRRRQPDPLGKLGVFPFSNPTGTIVTSGHPGLVDTVLVAGRIVKRGGRLVGVDLPALKARLLESRNRIAAAAGVPLDGTWRPGTSA